MLICFTYNGKNQGNLHTETEQNNNFPYSTTLYIEHYHNKHRDTQQRQYRDFKTLHSQRRSFETHKINSDLYSMPKNSYSKS